MRLLRGLPLNLWWQASRLVVVGIVDRLRWLFDVCGSIQFFFLLLNEGALTRPMTFVSAMNAVVRHFLLSAGIFLPAPIGVTSVTPPSSVVLRPGVAVFVTQDRVHGLWCLRLLGLMMIRSVTIA